MDLLVLPLLVGLTKETTLTTTVQYLVPISEKHPAGVKLLELENAPRPSGQKCRCGHGSRPCKHYRAYTDGYCRQCRHARPCHPRLGR